jgi:chemosensory pili system protein ChpA (sensor histidine kinase/response regulator)
MAMRELAHGLEQMLERFIGKLADAEARSLIGAAIDALGGMLTVAEARALPQPAGDLVARLGGAVPGAAPAAPAAPVPPTADSLDFSLAAADTVTAAPAAEVTSGLDLGDLDFALPTGSLGAAPAPPEPPEDEPPSLDFSQVMPILGGAASPSAAPMGEPAIVVPPIVTPAPTPQPPRAAAAPSNVVAFPVQQEEAPPAEPAAVEVEEIPVEGRTRRHDNDIDGAPPIFPRRRARPGNRRPRDWRASPDNAAAGNGRCAPPTLKGSARMCGAMALGELTHHMESRVENALTLKQLPSTLFDELEVSFDRMGFLYDRLVNPQAAGAPLPEPDEAPAPAAASRPHAATPAATSAATEAAAPAAPRAAAAPAAPKAAEQPKPEAQAPGAEPDPAAATARCCACAPTPSTAWSTRRRGVDRAQPIEATCAASRPRSST